MSAPKFVLYLGDDEIQLPTKFEVCWQCEGKGSHVNQTIDGNGISPEEFAEDPDFAESYFAGHYDVQCTVCKGLRVVPDLDESRCNPEHLKAFRKQEEDSARDYESERWLRMAESGERW